VPISVTSTLESIAARPSQPASSLTIFSTGFWARALKWSMETKISIFQLVSAVLGLGSAIFFSSYAWAQGKTSNQIGDKSLAISMWQACMQFPNTTVRLFISFYNFLLLSIVKMLVRLTIWTT
jgi:hypothetical protein